MWAEWQVRAVQELCWCSMLLLLNNEKNWGFNDSRSVGVALWIVSLCGHLNARWCCFQTALFSLQKQWRAFEILNKTVAFRGEVELSLWLLLTERCRFCQFKQNRARALFLTHVRERVRPFISVYRLLSMLSVLKHVCLQMSKETMNILRW